MFSQQIEVRSRFIHEHPQGLSYCDHLANL
jgi:hypothetical protein